MRGERVHARNLIEITKFWDVLLFREDPRTIWDECFLSIVRGNLQRKTEESHISASRSVQPWFCIAHAVTISNRNRKLIYFFSIIFRRNIPVTWLSRMSKNSCPWIFRSCRSAWDHGVFCFSGMVRHSSGLASIVVAILIFRGLVCTTHLSASEVFTEHPKVSSIKRFFNLQN
jgi:hypothetical protein